MAYLFGDSFDCYAAPADLIAGYWDSGSVASAQLLVGRFSGSQSFSMYSGSATTAAVVKTSGQNDAIHHLSFAYTQTQPLTGSAVYTFFTLYDGATAQCSVVMRQDGAILLTSGAANGTTLATYTGALTAASTWYQFEIEVRVSNTAGYMIVRKLGNTSNDFASATNLDTAGGTANDYANRLGSGGLNSNVTSVDDLLWRSDSVANGVPWAGDIRCQTRRPASDASVQWTRSGTGSLTQTIASGSSSTAVGATVMRLVPCTVLYSGSLSAVTVATFASVTGNMKCAIYADSAGVPAAVLASAGPITSVAAGNNVFTISPVLTVTPGQKLWLAFLNDTSAGTWTQTLGSTIGGTATASFATFPQANPVMTTGQTTTNCSITYAIAASNAALVQEPQQDAATTYVYSSNVGDSDLYTISSIATTPASIVAVTTRAFLQKSDAGTRNTSVRLRSGGVNSDSASAALNTVWGWQYVTNTTDPATGAAWTAVGVNNAQVGVIVTA